MSSMKYIVVFSFMLAALATQAQDRIIKLNGDTLKGYVDRVEKKEIKYRRVDDREAPLYSVDKLDVKRIEFENGNVEAFDNEKNVITADYYFRNRIGWLYTDLVIGRMGFFYERLSHDGYYCYKGSLFAAPGKYSLGFDFTIYPTTYRKKFSYFFGPQLRTGYTKYEFWEQREAFIAGFGVSNGVTANLLPNLSLTGYFGLGLKFTWYTGPFSYNNPYNPFRTSLLGADALYPNATFGLSVNYQF